jgi:rhodanese-related sulfurtransferase
MKRLAIICASVVVALVAYASEYPDISISDLKSALETKKVAVIDVNGTESWEKAHIPGAIDFQANKGKLASVLPKDKDALVVAYCGGPKCMAYKEAAQAAKDLGYKNVKHLTAGISGWKESGQKTQQGG